MTDLHTLLDRAVDHHVEIDPAGAVRHGHAALRHRRRTIVVGVAAAVLAIGAATTAYTRPAALHLAPSHSGPPTVRAGAFEIPQPPEGWSVQAAGASLVVIAPAGLPKADLHDPNLQLSAVGKITLEYMKSDFDAPKSGAPVDYDGRRFYTWTIPHDPDHPRRPPTSMASVREDGGWLLMQEAPRLHWTPQQAIQYLDGVVMTHNAVPGS